MSTATAVLYNDQEFGAAMAAGCNPSTILQAAQAGIPATELATLAKSGKDIPAAIAAHLSAIEAARNAPIKARPGRNAGTLLKTGKNKGQPGEATGALVVVSGSARVFEACTPCQVAVILSNPALALEVATAVDAGKHDGQGYNRDSHYSVATELAKLTAHYAEAKQPPAITFPKPPTS